MIKILMSLFCISLVTCLYVEEPCTCHVDRLDIACTKKASLFNGIFYSHLQFTLVIDKKCNGYVAYSMDSNDDWSDPIDVLISGIPIPWKYASQIFPEYLHQKKDYIYKSNISTRFMNFLFDSVPFDNEHPFIF